MMEKLYINQLQCQVIIKDPEKTQDPAGIPTHDLLITLLPTELPRQLSWHVQQNLCRKSCTFMYVVEDVYTSEAMEGLWKLSGCNRRTQSACAILSLIRTALMMVIRIRPPRHTC